MSRPDLVAMAEGLRREHIHKHGGCIQTWQARNHTEACEAEQRRRAGQPRPECTCPPWPCDCGADEWNARLDALLVECRALTAVVEAARKYVDAKDRRTGGTGISPQMALALGQMEKAVRALDGKGGTDG